MLTPKRLCAKINKDPKPARGEAMRGWQDSSGASVAVILDAALAGSGFYEEEEPKRRCALPQCRAFLSRSNKGDQCFCHSYLPEDKNPKDSGTVQEELRADVGKILLAVSKECGVEINDLVVGGSKRSKKVVAARHIAIFFMKSVLKMSLKEIAAIFRYSHSAVANALHKFRQALNSEDGTPLKEVIRRLRLSITAS